MSSVESIRVMHRLLAVHQSSFPRYLQSAPPVVRGDRQAATDTLAQIVADQQLIAERITDWLLAAGSPPVGGEDFPMEFTDAHDLGIDYIIRRTIEYQRQDIEMIQRCVAQLQLTPSAHALAEEALGMAKGHLESLEELLPAPVQA